MNDRERFIATVTGKPADRPPYWLYWSPWRSTLERWAREGMPPEWDFRASFQPDQPPLALPVNCGPCPKFERTVIEESDEFVIFYDEWGIKRRDFKHGESMSEFIEFPVKNRRDWERFKEERLNPSDPRRLDGDWKAQAAEWQARGWPIQLGYFPDGGVFGPFRWLMGDEEGLVAFHTQPELVHEIMDTITEVYLAVFEEAAAAVPVDVIHLWEDMCYRGGPLISPRHWEEFMGPNYRRIQAFAEAHHIPVISVDTDGNPDRIAPPMIRAGVNLLFPVEVAAGCDVNDWRARYPNLALMGGIDKRVLALGKAEIDAELERIRPAVRGGGYIPDLDHLVPDDVPWENYCYYAERLKELVYTLD